MRAALIFAVLGIAASACSPVVTTHGYLMPAEAGEPQPGVDTKESIQARMGSPSTTGVFEDTWYYVTVVREDFAYLEPLRTYQQVVAIQFDEDGTVSSSNQYDLADARDVRFARAETPTRGRTLSFWEQLFGSLSTVAAQQLPGRTDTLPESAGGPNPF